VERFEQEPPEFATADLRDRLETTGDLPLRWFDEMLKTESYVAFAGEKAPGGGPFKWKVNEKTAWQFQDVGDSVERYLLIKHRLLEADARSPAPNLNFLAEYGVGTYDPSTVDAMLVRPTFQAGDRKEDGPPMRDESMWRADAIRVFISHIAEYRVQVGELAKMLDYYGFSAFVAHDAIEPTQVWQDVIQDALSTCHILVAYLTPGFHESRWTDQEVGWAMGGGALIVPINVGIAPYGFLARYQAAAMPGHGLPSATLVSRAIAIAVFKSQPQAAANLTMRMVDVVVTAFEMADSFNDARLRFALLQVVPRALWTERHFERMSKAADENGQLRQCNLDSGVPLPEALDALIGEIRAVRRS
jgi:hypothetical protein